MAGDPTTDIALVSGANKGIGKEISRRLGAAGRTVIMGSRDEQRGQQAVDELRGQGHDVHLVVLDVTDEDSITSAAKQIDQEFGRLDVLVNNAGVWLEGVTPCDQVTVEEMRRTYEVNVFGVAAVTNAMLPLLRRSANAKIVNMASPLGSLMLTDDPASPVASMGLLAYNSSKTALNSLTLLYANFLRDSGIKVNSASPGFVATDLNGHRGELTVEQGANIPVQMATLGPDGPTGVFVGEDGSAHGSNLPW
jgi:NAD(P)-dependent dehydrogenase (short-subunit alcohol dehydrogenase family)